MAQRPQRFSFLAVLRDFFIPHRGNNYQPHSLRTKAVVAALLLLVLLEVALLTSVALRFGSREYLALVLPEAIVSLTNGQRAAYNLPPLSVDKTLSEAAQAHAEEMAAKGYFSHMSPEGNLPWVWFQKFGYPYQFAGENLAVNFFDSTDVVTAWMNSPTHRDNIIKYEFSDIGIGVANGTYEGRSTTFVVQFFGTKKALAVLPQSTPPPAPRPTPSPAPSPTPEPQPSPAPSPTPVPTPTPSQSLAVSQVQGETTSGGLWSSAKQVLRTAPRILSNYIFLTLLGLFTISFLLAFLIKLRIQYARIITHGLALMALALGMFLANNAILGGNIEVPHDNLNAAVIEVVNE